MILQAIVGYCFVIANAVIGLANIRDLNNMKGDIPVVKAHKLFGRIEILLFYALTAQCIYMFAVHVQMPDPNLYRPSGVASHSWIGGFAAVVLVTIKLVFARWKKDQIYKYGQYLGPLGVTGWSLSYWTSLYNYYFVVKMPPVIGTVPTEFIWAAVIPFPVGIALGLFVLRKSGSMGEKGRFAFHQIAFMLHGMTFGYEKSARELLGTPALFKYVVPQTYQFLEKMLKMSGFDIDTLSDLNLNDALKKFQEISADIHMAERIKIDWESEKTFSIESINCSTARVRSVMKPDELTNAICPWAIMAAALVNKVTGKELQIDPSSFNEIGAITRLTILED